MERTKSLRVLQTMRKGLEAGGKQGSLLPGFKIIVLLLCSEWTTGRQGYEPHDCVRNTTAVQLQGAGSLNQCEAVQLKRPIWAMTRGGRIKDNNQVLGLCSWVNGDIMLGEDMEVYSLRGIKNLICTLLLYGEPYKTKKERVQCLEGDLDSSRKLL